MNQIRRRFHIRIKRSYYIPIFLILLGISVSVIFIIHYNSKDSSNYPNSGDKYGNAHQNQDENIDSKQDQISNEVERQQTPFPTASKIPKKAPKYRYSHLINEDPPEKKCLDRAEYKLNLLIPYGLDPTTHHENDPYVLVLGSGGLVGSALERILRNRGYKTLHVLSRHHLDLRINQTLDLFKDINITFVYFLAYEVGGAKFLQLPELQKQILEYNLKITDHVFSWLEKRQIRFAFASSSLSADKSAYGHVKRLGENMTFGLPHLGRVFRLWNAYGYEYPGPKSHAIPDFIFQCLTSKKIKMLTSGEELRQFTHVNDISAALIAIMEYFDETPREIDISDGNWLRLVDTAKAAQKNIPGCELIIPEKHAKVQTRHEANLTSNWHLNRWQQKLTLDEGMNIIIDDMSKFINRSNTGSAVTFVINCGAEINDAIIDNINYIVSKIDEMNSALSPMRIEIIAASKAYNSEKTPPCTLVINDGYYLRKAIKFAHSDPIVIMDYNVLPTMTHLYFFQREIPRDLIFYFSEKQNVDKMEDAHGETNASFATIQIVNECNKKYIIPNDLSFIVATKETWKSVKVPPEDVNINDWFMRLKCGFISIKFESPVWSWGESVSTHAHSRQRKACCKAYVPHNSSKSGDSFIHYGARKLIK